MMKQTNKTAMAAAVSSSTGSADIVVAAMREAIFLGEYAPNQWLVEADLSVRFDASRSTIRSALVSLASEGVVERIRNRGARVRKVTEKEAIEIAEVKRLVQALCAGKAADRATVKDCARLRGTGTEMKQAVAAGDLLRYIELDRQLHSQIRQISGHTTASAVLERLRDQDVQRLVRLALHPGRATMSLQQHLAVIDAICAHNASGAEKATRDCLNSERNQ
jgi:DNA-binding GntR family transcriptional regulator